MAKAPELGMYVEQTIHGLLDTYHFSGIVSSFLTSQFSFTSADGHNHMCMFYEDWKPVAKTKKEPITLVESPSVWRTHQYRTCIVIEATTDQVTYIPMTVDDPIDVQVADEKRFRTQMYLEPLDDYPVERAARLFTEFARNTGATDKALKALSQLTTVTKEEMAMAKEKAKASKAPAKKKAPAKNAAATKEKKPRGPSAASVFMELLMEKGDNGECKHTDDQIFARVQKKFDLDDKKRSYVSWYRNKLTKDGKKPPAPKGGAKPKAKAGRPAAKKAPAKKEG